MVCSGTWNKKGESFMRFRVSRTSLYDDSQPPCPEAVEQEYTPVDVRTVDGPAKVRVYGGKRDWWYAEGTNHRVVNGRIVRDLPPRKGWFVELESLDALIAFYHRHGALIIVSPVDQEDILEIEIDDDY